MAEAPDLLVVQSQRAVPKRNREPRRAAV